MGENIQVEGDKTFFEQKIESMQIENKEVGRAKKREEIAIKINQKVFKNDHIFILKERL